MLRPLLFKDQEFPLDRADGRLGNESELIGKLTRILAHVARQNAEGQGRRAPDASEAVDQQVRLFGQAVDESECRLDRRRTRSIRGVRVDGVAESEFQVPLRRQVDHRKQTRRGRSDGDEMRWCPKRAIVPRLGLRAHDQAHWPAVRMRLIRVENRPVIRVPDSLRRKSHDGRGTL